MPIKSADLFFGRQKEVGALIEHLNTPGQHALLFGDRGVGKSSLANIACELLLKQFASGDLYVKRCDSTDTFVSVVADPLRAVGVEVEVAAASQTKAEGGGANIGVPGLGAKVDSTTSRSTSYASARDLASPSWVAAKLATLAGLFLIDEVDALTNHRDRHLLAELVKHLSDNGSKLKVLLVGIADTGADLMAGHPSVNRCMKETRLKRMSDAELRGIIEGGEKRAKISFSETAKNRAYLFVSIVLLIEVARFNIWMAGLAYLVTGSFPVKKLTDTLA